MAQLSYSLFMPFTITAASESASVCFPSASHVFENLIENMLDFFADGKSRVPKEQTLAIAALLEKSVALLHGK